MLDKSPEIFDEKVETENIDPRTQQVRDLATKLCAIPSISMPTEKANEQAINEVYSVAREFVEHSGLRIIETPDTYPFLMVTFKENDPDSSDFSSDVVLSGHLDVVAAQLPGQFTPRIKDDMLVARGSADMKTVVATYLVWMADMQKKSGPKPPFVLMISCTEENASIKPYGTQHAIETLKNEYEKEVELAIVGERTGEMEHMGKIPVGPICDANRGLRWYKAETTGGESSEVFEAFANIIGDGRKRVDTLNSIILPDRMLMQNNWRTGFVNSFLAIDGKENLPESVSISFKIKGSAKHSAQVSSREKTAIERYHELFQSAQDAFGKNKVKPINIIIGEEDNFNTTGNGGEMLLDIKADSDIIENWLKLVNNNDVETKIIAEAQKGETTENKAVFGLDIREIPEHTDIINLWVNETRKQLEKLGISFEEITFGDGWECPYNNPHYKKLRKAYEKVMGEPSPRLGKPHGNDGRFFNGNAVVFGQTGQNPHGPNEAHYLGSIAPYLQILDELAKQYI